MTETYTISATYDQIAADYAAHAGRNDALAESRGRFAARQRVGFWRARRASGMGSMR